MERSVEEGGGREESSSWRGADNDEGEQETADTFKERFGRICTFIG